jgi:hypothetical protein
MFEVEWDEQTLYRPFKDCKGVENEYRNPLGQCEIHLQQTYGRPADRNIFVVYHKYPVSGKVLHLKILKPTRG